MCISKHQKALGVKALDGIVASCKFWWNSNEFKLPGKSGRLANRVKGPAKAKQQILLSRTRWARDFQKFNLKSEDQLNQPGRLNGLWRLLKTAFIIEIKKLLWSSCLGHLKMPNKSQTLQDHFKFELQVCQDDLQDSWQRLIATLKLKNWVDTLYRWRVIREKLTNYQLNHQRKS